MFAPMPPNLVNLPPCPSPARSRVAMPGRRDPTAPVGLGPKPRFAVMKPGSLEPTLPVGDRAPRTLRGLAPLNALYGLVGALPDG